MPKIDIGYSPFRYGAHAAILYTHKERIYFHFASKEQARKAILKVDQLRTTEEIKNALKKLSGDDYFCPSEESARSWESWQQSNGIHSSSSSSDQSNSSLSG